jgi:hypothetical protein
MRNFSTTGQHSNSAPASPISMTPPPAPSFRARTKGGARSRYVDTMGGGAAKGGPAAAVQARGHVRSSSASSNPSRPPTFKIFTPGQESATAPGADDAARDSAADGSSGGGAPEQPSGVHRVATAPAFFVPPPVAEASTEQPLADQGQPPADQVRVEQPPAEQPPAAVGSYDFNSWDGADDGAAGNSADGAAGDNAVGAAAADGAPQQPDAPAAPPAAAFDSFSVAGSVSAQTSAGDNSYDIGSWDDPVAAADPSAFAAVPMGSAPVATEQAATGDVAPAEALDNAVAPAEPVPEMAEPVPEMAEPVPAPAPVPFDDGEADFQF